MSESEREVDRAVEATFPASDPPAFVGDVGPDPLADFEGVAEKSGAVAEGAPLLRRSRRPTLRGAVVGMAVIAVVVLAAGLAKAVLARVGYGGARVR